MLQARLDTLSRRLSKKVGFPSQASALIALTQPDAVSSTVSMYGLKAYLFNKSSLPASSAA